MGVTLSDDARRHIAVFESETGATANDCVLTEDRAVFVVAAGEMGLAIGRDGETVRALEDRLGCEVTLVEDAATVEAFVANALAPAAVYGVEMEERDGETVAVADVDDADRGVAIGADGRNVAVARLLAERHFGVDEIELA